MRGRTYSSHNNQPIVVTYFLVRRPPRYYSQRDSNQWEDGKDNENGKQLGRLVSSQFLIAQGSHGLSSRDNEMMIYRSRDLGGTISTCCTYML